MIKIYVINVSSYLQSGYCIYYQWILKFAWFRIVKISKTINHYSGFWYVSRIHFIRRTVINWGGFYCAVKHADNTCGCSSVCTSRILLRPSFLVSTHVHIVEIYIMKHRRYREDRRAASRCIYLREYRLARNVRDRQSILVIVTLYLVSNCTLTTA